ncbi:MAG: NAD(P)/FAD-dependent oxidoreductase [Cyclobacteriaceae bacterium]
MGQKVGIIGGGIIGLSCAYYLQQSGHGVTIIDKGDLTDGCSMGNAGMVVPSHIIPLASPGMIRKGIRWMFNPRSPFYVRPRFSGDLIRWGYLFYRHATTEHVERAIPALKELSLFSKSLYQQWSKELPFDFGYHERGLLMLYRTKEAGHEEEATARIASQHGLVAKVLSAGEVQELEPHVKVSVKGGVFFPGDAHLTPQKLTTGLIQYLENQGVKFMLGETVVNVVLKEKEIRLVKTTHHEFDFDLVVVATGSWSGEFCKLFGLSLPMQAGKGYSFTVDRPNDNVNIPSILLEDRVAVTPMGKTLRFGGTMEITGVNHSINMKRVEGIVNAIPRYYPKLELAMPDKQSVWHGLRPCSPDGLPYIGRVGRFKNLILATGHSMMGLSLAPGTGKLVAQLVNTERPAVPLVPFAADRFD